MKAHLGVLGALVCLALAGAAGCSSADTSTRGSVGANQTAELSRLFAQETATAPFDPSRVTNHGEAMVHMQTNTLDVYVTFQSETGITWPTQQGVAYIFHPAADWAELVGRDASGQLVQVAPEDAAKFIVHGESRRDICNGAALDVVNATVSDSLGHTYSGVKVRLTVVARGDRTSTSGLHATDTSPSQSDGDPSSQDDNADNGPKQCQSGAGGGQGDQGGDSTESLHILSGASGVLNGGCPLFTWAEGGCSQSCQTKVNIGAFGIEACLYAGTPGKCTEHQYWTNGVAGRGGVGVPNQGHYEKNCTCD
jgi:hypothetical protein